MNIKQGVPIPTWKEGQNSHGACLVGAMVLFNDLNNRYNNLGKFCDMAGPSSLKVRLLHD